MTVKRREKIEEGGKEISSRKWARGVFKLQSRELGSARQQPTGSLAQPQQIARHTRKERARTGSGGASCHRDDAGKER